MTFCLFAAGGACSWSLAPNFRPPFRGRGTGESASGFCHFIAGSAIAASLLPFRGAAIPAIVEQAETVKIGGKSLYTISWKGSRVSLKFGKQVAPALIDEAQESLKQFLTGWLKKRVKS